ncbi:unnamed protein product [Ectocarpus sp. 6 AP-2014]
MCERAKQLPEKSPVTGAYTTTWALYIGLYSLFPTGGTVMRAVFQSAFVIGIVFIGQLATFRCPCTQLPPSDIFQLHVA